MDKPTTWPPADFVPHFSPGASARIASMERGAGVGALRQNSSGEWEVYVTVTPSPSHPDNWAWLPWGPSHQVVADRFARYGAGWEDPAVTWEAVNNVYEWLKDLENRVPSEMEYSDFGYRPRQFEALRVAYLAKHPVPGSGGAGEVSRPHAGASAGSAGSGTQPHAVLIDGLTVSVLFTDPRENRPGFTGEKKGPRPASGSSLTPNLGSFYFFSPDNLELFVKILANRYIYIGALTDVGWTLTVTDAGGKTVYSYHNAEGHALGVAADFG